ncbi:MAG: NYN domain-containing protein [Burkholderiales bacterium]
MAAPNDVTSMALFCDFENIALGVRDAHYDKFDIGKVLERLLLKGSIVVKKAYCDWERYKAFKAPMHEASFELIEIPHVRQSGKNSADIRMVVDALDLCYTKTHVETFVIISGDSDFSPLVSKLRENDKVVIGVGVKNSTSDLLVTNCDEFIFYDDLVRAEKKKAATRRGGAKTAAAKVAPDKAPAKAASSRRRSTAKATEDAGDAPAEASAVPAADAVAPAPGEAPPRKSDEERRDEALDLIVGTVDALISERGAEEKIWGSMIKQALKRRKPGFNESYYGFRSFNAMLEAAAAAGSLALERDEKSGGYLVRLAAGEE